MKTAFHLSVFGFVCALLFVGCEKKEEPHPLPPPGDAQNIQLQMGKNYEMQVFFSFENGIIDSSRNDSWDISFTNGSQIYEVRTNGGNEISLKPTGRTDFGSVTDTQTIPGKSWLYDDPSGLKGSSGLGDIITNGHLNEVLLVKVPDLDANEKKRFRLYKLQVSEADESKYVIRTDTITGTTGTSVTMERDQDYNFSYFSFKDGVTKPEPPKAEWDIVLTRYLYIYRKYNPDGSDFPYLVNGALLNPYQTTAGDDSTRDIDFSGFTAEDAVQFTLYPNRDVIGYDWKSVDITTGQYTVLPGRIFVVSTQRNELWKLHFVGFYRDGIKGNPQFEYKRLR